MPRSQKFKSTRKRSPRPRRRSSRKYRGGILATAKSAAATLSAKGKQTATKLSAKGKEAAAILQQKGKEAVRQAAAIAKEKRIKTCISFLEDNSYQVIAPQ